MGRTGVNRVVKTVLYLSIGPGTQGRPLFTGLWQVAPRSHRQSSCGPLGAGPAVPVVGAVPGPYGWFLLGVFWCSYLQWIDRQQW